MDAQDFRSLQEAYSQVYQVDEAIRNPESRKMVLLPKVMILKDCYHPKTPWLVVLPNRKTQ